MTWLHGHIYQPRAFIRFKCERQSCSLFTGQYVTVLTPGYTLRARDATRKEGRGLHSGSAFPREPRRPSACTSHPVAGQRQQRSFLYFRDFHISTILCARALWCTDWLDVCQLSSPHCASEGCSELSCHASPETSGGIQSVERRE